MKSPLKIVMISSEVAPFAKTGGLADVVGALPQVLRGLGHEVIVVMPRYGSIDATQVWPAPALGFDGRLDGQHAGVVRGGHGVQRWGAGLLYRIQQVFRAVGAVSRRRL